MKRKTEKELSEETAKPEFLPATPWASSEQEFEQFLRRAAEHYGAAPPEPKRRPLPVH